jgi:signal transduction histidine kinase
VTGREPLATVLVVDDQDAARFAKTRILERAGFRVFDAATGHDALETAARVAPDLVVLDVHLPDLHGFEVARRLRAANTSLPSLQIVQVSSTAIGAADKVRGLEQGADVYLTEPLDPDVLVATVRSLLRVRRVEALLAAALEGERTARQELEEASRLKDEFIATLSHELRTPLNAVMGWIFQLRHSTLDADAQARALDSLERNVRVQAQLINDLLDISRISKGKLQLQITWTDLCTAVEAAIESVRASIALKDVALHADLTSVIVAGDPARLQQIAANLLTNAAQFTPEHGAIRVTTARDGARALLCVQDTGAGIERAFLPHVFDQFRQGAGGLSRKHGGLGLGLSVVRQLVELHGGSVVVQSEGAGRGATFTVELPIDPDVRVHPGAPILEGLTIAVVGPPTFADEVSQTLEAAGAEVLRSHVTNQTVSDLPDARVDAVVHDRQSSAAAGVMAETCRSRILIEATLPVSPAVLARRVARAVASAK